MFKKALFAIATLIGCTTSANADIWIDGNLFCENSDSIQTTIPFATVTMYDIDNHNDQKYFAVANDRGYFEVKPYDYTKPYYMEISAPGYETRKTTITAIKSPLQYNNTINIRLKPSGIAPAIGKTTYTGDSLAKGTKILRELLLATVPGIQNEGEDWFTDNDGSVLIFFNDWASKPEVLQILMDNAPSEEIDQIDVFKLPEGLVYECAIRINIPAVGHLNFPKYYFNDSSYLKEIR